LSTSERDECYRKDWRVFVLSNFLNDHPSSLVHNYDQLNYLLSEKNTFNEWLIEIKNEWSLLNDVPAWLINHTELRDLWLNKYQQHLVDLKNFQKTTDQMINEANSDFDKRITSINNQLEDYETKLYVDNPVLLIHKITAAALPEADLLRCYALNKQDRRLERKNLVNKYKLKLLRDYESKLISIEDLIKLVK
jgi:hypothetical protein